MESETRWEEVYGFEKRRQCLSPESGQGKQLQMATELQAVYL